MAGAYLEEHPPARSQYRAPRRDPVSGVVVVHSAENVPDFVAFDGGAEAVARFISTRTDAPGSYHDLVDSDSAISVVPYWWEAFHDGTGSNRHSLGLSVATRADVWPMTPARWREGAIRQMGLRAAVMNAYVKAQRGFEIPARWLTRDQSEARMPGFITHARRDPARRHDPGAGFPGDDFLDAYSDARRGGVWVPSTPFEPPITFPEDDMKILDCAGQKALLLQGDGVRYLDAEQREAYVDAGVKAELISFESHLRIINHQLQPTVTPGR